MFVRELATSLQTPLAIDADGDVGAHTSIAIGENGYPIISYFDELTTTSKSRLRHGWLHRRTSDYHN